MPDYSTQIYTFDSLAARHPQAINRLNDYLQMEATDKKGMDRSQLTPAQGTRAHVPTFPRRDGTALTFFFFFFYLGSRARQLLRLRDIPFTLCEDIHEGSGKGLPGYLG